MAESKKTLVKDENGQEKLVDFLAEAKDAMMKPKYLLKWVKRKQNVPPGQNPWAVGGFFTHSMDEILDQIPQCEHFHVVELGKQVMDEKELRDKAIAHMNAKEEAEAKAQYLRLKARFAPESKLEVAD